MGRQPGAACGPNSTRTEQRHERRTDRRAVRRVDAFEHAWCLRLNRGCSQPAVRDIFAAISKLGDGVWYVLILLLPVMYGEVALYPALRMAAVGDRHRRPRPASISSRGWCASGPTFRSLASRPERGALDRYSFFLPATRCTR